MCASALVCPLSRGRDEGGRGAGCVTSPDLVTRVLMSRTVLSVYIQGDTSGRGKAFVDIKIGSSDYQLGCWAAIGTGARCHELLNKTFSATRRVTLSMSVCIVSVS